MFPQQTHDRVLCCIFKAVKVFVNPAHRELIDLVMSIKESMQFANMDSISKTKVRGILALLKHSDILVTSGTEGLPVNLVLAPGIESFEILRDRHDSYINSFIKECRILIPRDFLNEIIWKRDYQWQKETIQEMNQFQNIVESFIRDVTNKNLSINLSMNTSLQAIVSTNLNPYADWFYNKTSQQSYNNLKSNSSKTGSSFTSVESTPSFVFSPNNVEFSPSDILPGSCKYSMLSEAAKKLLSPVQQKIGTISNRDGQFLENYKSGLLSFSSVVSPNSKKSSNYELKFQSTTKFSFLDSSNDNQVVEDDSIESSYEIMKYDSALYLDNIDDYVDTSTMLSPNTEIIAQNMVEMLVKSPLDNTYCYK